MFECSLDDFVLWVLWHVLLWPGWYTYVFFWEFYDDKVKTSFRLFSVIDNLCIKLCRSDVSEYCDVGDHMEV